MKMNKAIGLALCLPVMVFGQSAPREVDTLAALAALSGTSNQTVFVRRATTSNTHYDGTSRLMSSLPWDGGVTNLNRVRSTSNPNIMWLTNAPIDLNAYGGGNVFTGTTNPQGAVPAFGTGNTNIVDTLVSIAMQTNLLAGTLTASNLTSGSVIIAGTSGVLSQDNLNFFYNDSNDRLGIGTNAPAFKLDVDNGSVTGSIANFQSAADGGGPILRVTNPFTSPGSIDENTAWTFVHATSTAGQILCGRTEDFTVAANRSAYMSFSIRGNNTFTESFRIDSNANVGFGDTTPAHPLVVINGEGFAIGTSAAVVRIQSTDAGHYAGSGSPEASQTASPGSIYGRTGDGTLWVKNTGVGNTGWVQVSSGAVNPVVATKTLTDNVATDVFTVALAALARSGLEVRFEIDVTNGTDTQTFTDTRRVSAVNKAGTVTSALSAPAAATATSSADTLNVTVTISSTATDYTYVVTADTSLGTPTLTMRYTILNFNGAAITLL